ncbi:fungal-specific transcription factor domain-containing protein [Lentinula aciculospora]|uniref:Fungal-specific transcription factor domain-containing protein n=1 Tax=Lentinula aciculospora TaxID=153920 RepID=A0A9W9AIA5_9AGAR|nr:fungal-specific transcription factor domain-containing protein [Lentinula aciculospora]
MDTTAGVTAGPLSVTPSVTSSTPLNVFTNPYLGDNLSQSDSEDGDTNTISERLEELTLGQQFPRHFGTSSNVLLVQTVLDFKERATGHKQDIYQHFKRSEFWCTFPWQRDLQNNLGPLIFPDDDLLHDLINDYFVHFEPYTPLLHRSTFERSITEGLHLRDFGFGQVVLAVCAVASRCGNDPRNRPEGTDSEHSLGWPWYSQISLDTFSHVEAPRLYDLQLCLMIIYLQASAISESSWIILGIAMRLAQAKGVHRKRPGQARTIERELWIRAFWTIIAWDVYASMFLGRPRITTIDDFDVELPADCDQEFWIWDNSTTETEIFVQPPDKPSKMSFWIHFIKLMQIAGLVCKLIYPIRKSEQSKVLGVEGMSRNQRAVMELDSALNAWVGSVPDHVKWDPNRSDPVSLLQSTMLYTSYYWMQVHRKFIPGPGRETILNGFPSMAICANAARSCIRIAQSCEIIHQAPVPPVLISAIMLLINFWRDKRTNMSLDSGNDIREVHKCFELAKPFEKR